MEIIVYTALFAHEDLDLKDVGEFISYQHDKGDVRYIALTNRTDLKSDFWDVQHVNIEKDLSPRMMARKVKWNPSNFLDNHIYSLWLDSNAYLTRKPEEVFSKCMQDYHTRIHRHTDIPCVYLEGTLVNYEFELDVPSIVNRQLEGYFEEGLPFLYDHYDTAVLMRKNCNAANNLSSAVYNEIKTKSIRDQMAISYCIWKARSSGDYRIETINESFLPHTGLLGFPKSIWFTSGNKPVEKLVENLGVRRVLGSVAAQQRMKNEQKHSW